MRGPSKRATASTFSSSGSLTMADAPSFYALVIGINDYSDGDLSGPDGEGNLICARADAERMHEFLVETLQVPSENIQTLYDKEATRDHILTTFRHHLIENSSINKNDPILFYFSGHGTQTEKEVRSPDESIVEDTESDDDEDHLREAICPADRRADSVPDIEDQELGKLLVDLANRKGDNITVIMDCCHSGSGTRGASVARWRERYVRPLRHARPMTRTTVHRHAHIKPGPLDTHVLLAACRRTERAWETSRGGWFTSRLLDLLKDHTLPTTTYSCLMSKIRQLKFDLEIEEEGMTNSVPVTQTPQCEGKGKDGLLFRGKGLGADRRLVHLTIKNGLAKVKAGAIHGVTQGTRFLVQGSDQFSLDPLCEATATRVQAVSCYVDLPRDRLPHNLASETVYYARISYRMEPPYPIAFTYPAASERQNIVEAGLQALTVEHHDVDMPIVRSDPSQARMIVAVHEDTMELTRRWPIISQSFTGYGPVITVLLQSGPGDSGSYDLQRISAAARFDFFLHHENPNHPYRDGVSAKLYKVTDDGRDTDKSKDFAAGCVAHLQDDSDTLYALYLENRTNIDLYPAVYYFDPSNHSIFEMYKAATHNPGVAPLKARKTSTIGTRDDEGTPFNFFLAENEDEDTGFVKIFLSERYAEMKIIEQQEGFTHVPPEQSMSSRAGDIEDRKPPGNWDSITICIKTYRDLSSLELEH